MKVFDKPYQFNLWPKIKCVCLLALLIFIALLYAPLSVFYIIHIKRETSPFIITLFEAIVTFLSVTLSILAANIADNINNCIVDGLNKICFKNKRFGNDIELSEYKIDKFDIVSKLVKKMYDIVFALYFFITIVHCFLTWNGEVMACISFYVSVLSVYFTIRLAIISVISFYSIVNNVSKALFFIDKLMDIEADRMNDIKITSTNS